MADGRSYGDYLREARERCGIDLVSMARTLHIRPDIVGAIESADFNKMPAHGYSKNMIRAYARHVGLDEARISQMYADERDAFDGIPGPARTRRSSSRTDRLESRSRNLGAPSRRLPDDAQRRAGARSTNLSRPVEGVVSRPRSKTAPAAQRSSLSGFVGSLARERTPKESRVRSSFTQGGTPSGFGSSGTKGRTGSGIALPAFNLPIILAVIGGIVIIVLAVILFNGGKQSVDDIPDIPISGLTDTSAVSEDAQTPQLEAAPSSALFSFSVEEGGKAWVTIYMDGDPTPVYAAVAEGPITEDFEVTGTLTFETANITPITLEVDGEEVKASPASTGTNYVYTVDFPSILAAWKEAHGVGDSGEAGSSSSSSSSSASSSSSSTASASSSSASSSTR